ncbi:murein biosynthesis integral membrane protein MurJ [Candidatus Methylospira mobilis]|uniref:Probable lipid II flippase MurJ n=2 Tax=Candidatus Methylospira mobilis TaxID=1808979 RepID=A0A5Q0BNX9_9GAMM|nr:murein biosynthesis integral membrane protein MurJ [Candidatus Methylospira mobilis]
MLSRLLGFARDVVIARYFGVGPATDAFLVAFRIPNFLRRLFSDGSFSLAFLPLLRGTDGKGGVQGRLEVDTLFGALILLLLQISLAGTLAAPLLIAVFAPGLFAQPLDSALCTDMVRITFPYLFFIVLTAFAGGILNSRGHFAVPAFTPVLLNLCMIIGAIWFAPLLDRPIMALAWAVLLAGLLQFALQIPALAYTGHVPRPHFSLRRFRQSWPLLRGVMPSLLGVSVPQLNILVDTFFASFLMSGSISWLYYSDRYIELPVAMVGVALGTAILPRLANLHLQGDGAHFSEVLDWGLRWVTLISLPAALGLGMLSTPLMACVFGTDAARETDIVMAARSLMAYAPALPGLIAVRVLSSAYAARHDSGALLTSGLLAVLVNGGLGVALAFMAAPQGWRHAALTLSTALAALLQGGFLLHKLLRTGIYCPRPGWGLFLLRTGFAALIMAVGLLYGDKQSLRLIMPIENSYLRLCVLVAGGTGVYFSVLWLGGVRRRHLHAPLRPVAAAAGIQRCD